MGKYSDFCPCKHPKWDQNLQFTPLSKTTSILVTFMWESPRASRQISQFLDSDNIIEILYHVKIHN